MRAQINAGKLGELETVPMLQRLLQYRYASSNQLMPDHDIISEINGSHVCVRFFRLLVADPRRRPYVLSNFSSSYHVSLFYNSGTDVLL